MEHKINVCMISGAYPLCRDGIGDYTARLIDSFDKDNLEISLITSDEEPIRKYIEENSIKGVFPIIKRWNIFAVIAILNFIAKEKFDIIHLQFPSSRYKKTFSLCFLPLLIRLFFRKKTVLTLHEFSISYPINRLRQIFLILGSSSVVVTDNNEARYPVLSFISGKRKICVIPIGSNIDACKCDSKEKEAFLEKTGLSGQSKIIAFFGFIHPNKGLECLLRATRKAADEGVSVQLFIVSQLDFVNNAYHDKIKRLIDSLKLDKLVFVTGYLPLQEVSRFLSFSDVCVLPFTDGATLRRGTLMAALCHGKAIISTKSNRYVPPQLIDKENIFLIPVNDVEKLKEAIKFLCADNKIRSKIAEGASRLSKDFSWDKISQMHRELYQKVMDNL